ncbi:PEP-CTERM sorting domain-containing protein [Dechloromonas denitrificans]|uniref:PEP-CTERM sorting domain-containing protein n=1 Tax=Dechloromonas denitrificans TaxID=281362 RepID=UPI001CF9C36A|nr:PEP-CTERM sorting domain-containing protein [Dechloromonas denitrificans]UCV07563.1 PEP-CTERM sorting domain-containing protein [Dechloromonas denitrificans]
MKLNLISALVAGLFVAAPAFSANNSITLDFEGPASFDSIGDYYSGLGVNFGLDALAFQQADMVDFSNLPSGTGVMSAVGADAALNFAAGFSSASFYYSSSEAATVGVYSGLNGTGTLLGSFILSNNATLGCSNSAFCNWTQSSLAFNGVAHSIAFGEATYVAGFDNVTVAAVPEPSEALMLALGLGFVSQVVRRVRREKAGV